MKKVTATLILAIICMVSCTQKGPRKAQPLPPSKGLPSELLVVVDKAVWNSDLADTINSIVHADVPGLMVHEDYFRTSRVMSDQLTRSYTTMHSKLYVRLDPRLKKAEVGVAKDVTAHPQIEVVVAAPTLDELRRMLPQSSDFIRDAICDFQLEMRQAALSRKYSRKVHDDLKSVLGMTIRVPEDLRATKRGKDFLWGGTNLNEKDLNIVVYTLPSTTPLTEEALVLKRDSVMKANIPGSRPDQWMETVREQGTPIVSSRQRKIGGEVVLEMHGLWQMRNGGFGGSFVSISRTDQDHDRIIVAEGFVYSPSTDKRELLRQMEAAIRTLKF